jgi:SAM-dependent methyltransferase
MDIKELQKNWDAFGKKDALWSILTFSSGRNKRWDEHGFFKTGEEQIAQVMNQIKAIGLQLSHQRCLVFGCGVGRLTQALCQHFQECDGVDIAPSMIASARSYNRYGDRCRYHLNEAADLRLFADDSFDFVYCTLVLQHMLPEYSKAYVAEFVRVLRPGGLIIFQIPSEANWSIDRYRLPQSAFRAVLTLEEPLSGVAPEAQKTILVRVRNISDVAWPAVPTTDTTYQVVLGNHWLDASGQVVLNDDGRAALPQSLQPLEEVVVPLTITGPKQPGSYILELDLVQEMVSWFKDQGSQTLRIPVRNAFGAFIGIYNSLSGLLGRQPPAAAEKPPVMEMHTVRRAEIVEVIRQHNGRIVDIQEDTYCGVGWLSFTYFVTK